MLGSIKIRQAIVLAGFVERTICLVAPAVEFASQKRCCATGFGNYRVSTMTAYVVEGFDATITNFYEDKIPSKHLCLVIPEYHAKKSWKLAYLRGQIVTRLLEPSNKACHMP
jgi:hypothetical protein